MRKDSDSDRNEYGRQRNPDSNATPLLTIYAQSIREDCDNAEIFTEEAGIRAINMLLLLILQILMVWIFKTVEGMGM